VVPAAPAPQPPPPEAKRTPAFLEALRGPDPAKVERELVRILHEHAALNPRICTGQLHPDIKPARCPGGHTNSEIEEWERVRAAIIAEIQSNAPAAAMHSPVGELRWSLTFHGVPTRSF